MDKWFTPVNMYIFEQKGVNKLVNIYLRNFYSASIPHVGTTSASGIGSITASFHYKVGQGLLSTTKNKGVIQWENTSIQDRIN